MPPMLMPAAGILLMFLAVLSVYSWRRQRESELRKRDLLLDAITDTAAKLFTAPVLDAVVPGLLETAGQAIGADRVIVLENARSPDGSLLVCDRYIWNAPGVEPRVEPGVLKSRPELAASLGNVLASLSRGQTFTALPRTLQAEPAGFFSSLRIQSTLVAPILIEAATWGYFACDDCHAERNWTAAEQDAAKVLAEMLGAAIGRTRYITELADAQRIVENSTAILFRARAEPPFPVTYISANVSRWGYDPARFTASPLFYRTLIHPDDQARAAVFGQSLLTENESPPPLEFRLRYSDGTYRWFESRITAMRDNAGRRMGFEGMIFDVHERKQAEQELARVARTDALTSLANRTTFLERLDLAFAATRRGATPFAVLYVDLDRFKDVNDLLGHRAGDTLLKEVAQRLVASVRETDLVARFGGDEFAVLQADTADPSTAGTLAAKIRSVLAEPYAIEGSELRITASVGIAPYALEIQDPVEILAQADRALYRAKEEGRDRYRFHSRELDAIVHERVSLAEQLRAAIERDELELVYQPQVAIATGEIVGVEALVRWNHPSRGRLKPGVFIPAAERTGVIVPLGDWVLDRACRQFRLWRDQGVAPPVIAVNLSGAQLKLGRGFDRDVAAILKKWGVEPRELEFDVSESVLAASFGTHPDLLQQLRDLGVRIAIDDFGAEYTSFGRVQAYQVKRLKIAPQFISVMTSDPIGASSVRMMIHIARQLGIEIIAKSVETGEQQAFLLSATETAQAQGFYFSEPLTAARATEVLRRKRIEPEAGPVTEFPVSPAQAGGRRAGRG